MNFKESLKKSNEIIKRVGRESHHGKNIMAKATSYAQKDEDLINLEKWVISVEQGQRVIEFFLQLFDKFRHGGAVSPIAVFNNLCNPEVSIVAPGRSKEDNRNAVYLMIEDVYFKNEEDKKAFFTWFDALWGKIEPLLAKYEEFNHKRNLIYIKAHDDYQIDREAKKQKAAGKKSK